MKNFYEFHCKYGTFLYNWIVARVGYIIFCAKDFKKLLKLYKTLHPEDNTATEDSLTDVTIENVLTDKLYNDLGFIVNNKLLSYL